MGIPANGPYMGIPPNGWFIMENPIKMDFIWVNLKNVGPPFIKSISVYTELHQNVIYTTGKSFSVIMWP